jgi:cell wall-associated NlpC family hydrolase
MLSYSSYPIYKKGALIFILTILLYSCAADKKVRKEKKYKVHVIAYPKKDSSMAEGAPAPVKQYRELQLEFGKRLDVSPDSIFNKKLYVFIKEWLGTPYQWGGNSASGIDCSAFVQKLYKQVYDITVPRTSIQQFYTNRVELYSNTSYLTEGDLVFFKTIRNSNAVTHVGFYLHNGYFVNASSIKGVSLGSLYDQYWKVKYVASGRFKNPTAAKKY